jgi:predicted dehydrogenase
VIRIGLVGFGMAVRVFHAPLISSVSGLELAAVVERNSDLAAQRYPGIVTHRSLDSLLADASITLVVAATPNATHFDVARQAIEAGKNVVVDKPVAVRSAEIADLIALADQRGVHLIPFHNRRWDGEFLTVRSLLQVRVLGRLVHFESHMDRWNPGPARRAWKNDPEHGGGLLLDLGTHLVDQAVELFGLPQAVSAEIDRERDGEGANDSFTVRLRYAGFRATVGANMLSSPAAPRFHIRGTQGNYRKKGVDPQEPALNKITRIPAGPWGTEPVSEWGMLHVDVNGGMVTRPLETMAGDYRRFYEGVRNALEGRAELPVRAVEAWRVARILEIAQLSSEQRREIACSFEP